MFFNSDNITIYYEKYGNSDKTILILPGWGNTRMTFRNIINYFKDEYTIYVIDYPGFGNSPIPSRTLDIYDYANILKDFITKEQINPIIIAHSFGGRIISLLSGYYKIKFPKLILIDIAGIKPKKNIFTLFKEKIYKLLKSIIKLLPKIKREYYYQKLIKLFGSNDYNNLSISMRETFKNIVNKDLKIYFKNIEEDTLLIWGKKDKTTPLKDAYTLKKLLKNSSLIVYEVCGHFSYLDAPTTTNEIIKNFISN